MAAGEGVAASLLSPPHPLHRPPPGAAGAQTLPEGLCWQRCGPAGRGRGLLPGSEATQMSGWGRRCHRETGGDRHTDGDAAAPHLPAGWAVLAPNPPPSPPPSQRDTGTRFARWGSRLPHARRAGGFAHTQTWGSGDVPPIALTDSCTHTLHSPGLCLSLAHTHRGGSPPCTHTIGAPILCPPSPLLPPSLARSHTRTALSHTPSPPPPYKSPPSPSCSC